MAPRMIAIRCPNCRYENNPIPADMGDKTFQCFACGEYIHYAWRKNETEITDRPERTKSSGLTFY